MLGCCLAVPNLQILDNVVHHRVANPIESPALPHQHACAATLRNTTTIFCTIHYSRLYFRFIAIICILYFYLTGAGIVPNLAATAAVPLSAHPLRRRLALLTTTTLPLSN
jgi:hypothetical protein